MFEWYFFSIYKIEKILIVLSRSIQSHPRVFVIHP